MGAAESLPPLRLDPDLLPITAAGAPELDIIFAAAPAGACTLTEQAFVKTLGRAGVARDCARRLFLGRFRHPLRRLADRREVLCALLLLSNVDDTEKLTRVFNLFSCGADGRLTRIEAAFAATVLSRAIARVDPGLLPPLSEPLLDGFLLRLSGGEDFEPLSRNRFLAAARSDPLVASLLDCLGAPRQLRVDPHQSAFEFRDRAFPPEHRSLAPQSKWARELCIPPADRVSWRRCALNLGTDRQRLSAFSSLGRIIGGAFATTELLSAVAMLGSQPELLAILFAPTLQEDLGRCCVRLFVGGRWREVAVDDRLPFLRCGLPAALPLFSRAEGASCEWLGLLEKALAKSSGSYAHLSMALGDDEAMLTCLRALTGGHVSSKSTASLAWRYSDVVLGEADVSNRRPGLELISRLLEEGAILGLLFSGAADSNSFGCPPAGAIYPVTGLRWQGDEVEVALLDVWGWRGSGGITVKAREVPGLFDLLVEVRFPDARRLSCESRNGQHTRFSRWKSLVCSTSLSNSSSSGFCISVPQDHDVNCSVSLGRYSAPYEVFTLSQMSSAPHYSAYEMSSFRFSSSLSKRIVSRCMNVRRHIIGYLVRYSFAGENM